MDTQCAPYRRISYRPWFSKGVLHVALAVKKERLIHVNCTSFSTHRLRCAGGVLTLVQGADAGAVQAPVRAHGQNRD